MKTKNSRIVVKNYPYDETARAIFDILKDGMYHSTKNRTEETPFNHLIAVEDSEIKNLLDENGNRDEKAVKRYIFKKKRILLDQFVALRLLGFASMKSKTSSATYALNRNGMNMLKGLAIMEEAQKRNVKFETIWSALFGKTPAPEIE